MGHDGIGRRIEYIDEAESDQTGNAILVTVSFINFSTVICTKVGMVAEQKCYIAFKESRSQKDMVHT